MFESRNFSDAHMFFQYEDNLIMGINRRGELSAFGGRSEHNETLMATLIREYIEESHESIVTITNLVDLLKKNNKCFIDRRHDGKLSYSVLVHLDSFDYKNAAMLFHKYITCESKVHCEIVDLIMLPIKDVNSIMRSELAPIRRNRIRHPAIKSLRALLT
jgi:hypothetical protein